MIKKSDGFTMIEMMLAMAFVAFLMVAIALTTIFVSQTYQRGITLGQVNEAGRTIMTDMQQSIGQARVGQLSKWPTAFNSRVDVGAVCLGGVSYVWNSGKKLAASGAVTYDGGDRNGQPVRLAKVNDPNRAVCTEGVTSIDTDQSVELLGGADRNLAIQLLDVRQLQATSNQSLYGVEFIIGTNDRAALANNGTIADVGCRPPSEASSNLNYCAVNRFSFLVRAGGGK